MAGRLRFPAVFALGLRLRGHHLRDMLWRIKSSRRRQLPEGFITPCAPTLVPVPPSGSAWLHAIKHDGFRVLARRDGGRVRIWSRHATDWTDTFTAIAASMRALPVSHVMLDGEVVVLREDGSSDFGALFRRDAGQRASFLPFDVLGLDGDDVRQLPLEERHALVAGLVENSSAMAAVEAIEGDGPTVFRHACALGLEGIISKRRDSPYRCGRSTAWVKTKNSTYRRR